MAAALSVPIGMASIRYSEPAGYYGVSMHGRTGLPKGTELADVDRPWTLVGAEVVEASRRGSLWPLLARLPSRSTVQFREPGFSQDSVCVIRAAELAGIALTRREANELQLLESGSEPISTDGEIVRSLIRVAVGEELRADS
jgi:hypothetical protein